MVLKEQQQRQPPLKTIKYGHVSAAIWKNMKTGDKGQYAVYSVTFQKTYMKDGETRYGKTFRRPDIYDLIKCAEATYDELDRLAKEQQSKQENRSDSK